MKAAHKNRIFYFYCITPCTDPLHIFERWRL